LQGNHTLSNEIIQHLHGRVIFYINQIQDDSNYLQLYLTWKCVVEMGLNGDYANIWDKYIPQLMFVGILVGQFDDKLSWNGSLV